jgi:EmrB/QacA subfamily drug resistance transporter
VALVHGPEGALMEKKWWTLVAVCLGTFMLLLDVTIVNVALPDIQQSLHSSFSDLQWVVDAYALTLASLLLTAGSLADLFGRRILFTIGLVLFTLGSLFCGLAQSSEWLILARAGQGIGGAIMFSTSLALLAQAFQGRDRGVAFGIWGSITGVAVAVGPVVGGVLTSGLSWKWIFFVNIPIGAFAVGVTLLRVEESRQEGARRPDWVGFVVFTAALVSLVYALIRSSEKGWTETGVLVLFAAAAVLLVVFILQEHRSERAMFDLALFRNHTFDGGAIAAFGLSGSLFALLLYIVLYLQDGKGYSALGTGLRLLLLSAGIMVAATVAGRLTQRVPVRFLIGPGLALVGVGLLLMARIGASSSWTVLIPGFIVAGVGTGMVNPPLASTAVGVVEPRRAGMASGINSTFRQVGISTGVAALGSIFGSEVTRQLRHNLGSVPGLSGHVPSLAKAIQGGESSELLAHAPAAVRAQLAHATLASYAHGLDVVLVIGAVLALGSAVAALTLIRTSDFEASSQSSHRSAAAGGTSGAAGGGTDGGAGAGSGAADAVPAPT